ncbi:MAG: diacylglycerol kinase family protein [Patescibacteria group bacterium]
MFSYLYKVLRSFTYAAHGMISMLGERNMQVHITAAFVVIILGNILPVTQTEWYILLILIGAVFALEMMNTAVEELANIIRDELKLNYKATQRARDVAAGAVFTMAIIAALIGLAIFLPKILFIIE